MRVLEHKVAVILDPTKENDAKNVLRQHRSREKRYAFDYARTPAPTSWVYIRTLSLSPFVFSLQA